MTVSPFDHPFLSGLLGHDAVAAAFSFRAEIEAMLAFEMALARAESSEKVIPFEAANALAEATARLRPDKQHLRNAALRDGTPVGELVREIRRLVGEDHAPHIHYGASAQDVIDTSLALRLKGVVTDLERMLQAVVLSLDNLADTHGRRELTGRTRMQAALPITVAAKVRGWRAPLVRHLGRLGEIKPRVLVVQLGGAAGTHDVLGDRGPAVMKRMADLLRLGLPDGPWHSQRDGLAELAGWLSLVTGTLGKLGQDLLLMAQPEIGEVTISGAGSSMSVTDKQNQIGAEVLVTLARFNATLLPGLHHALVHENERSGAAWMLEWMLLPQMTVATATALDRAATVLARISSIGREGAGDAGSAREAAG